MFKTEKPDSLNQQSAHFAGFAVNSFFTAASAATYAVTFLLSAVLPSNKKNYHHNSAINFDGFINDQSTGAASRIKMGCRDGAYNGCGWIAAYNASVILGLQMKPADIVEHLEKNGGTLLNGLLGTNPAAIKKLFDRNGAETRIYGLPPKVDSLIMDSSASILMYAHKKGMHFVTICYNNGQFLLFNECAGKCAPTVLASVDSWLKNPIRNYSAVALIRIN